MKTCCACVIAIGLLGSNAFASDDPVFRLESFLSELGYEVGVADGIVDQKTHEAISAYQRDRGLIVTGGMNADELLSLEQEIVNLRANGPQVAANSESTPSEPLPDALRAEVGHIWLFSDYRTLPRGMSAFLGPGPGGAWDKPHQSLVEYRVYSLDSFVVNGASLPVYLAGQAKSHPFNANGIGLDGPYKGPAPDLAMACVLHTLPSAPERFVYNLSFWRAEPLRADPTNGSKSYDAAVGPETGWAQGADPCQNAFKSLGGSTKALLRSKPG